MCRHYQRSMHCQLSLRLFNKMRFQTSSPYAAQNVDQLIDCTGAPWHPPSQKKKKKKKGGGGGDSGRAKNDQQRELTNVRKTSHEHNKDPSNSKVQTLHHGCILKRYIYDSVGTNTSLSQRWGGSHGRVVKYTHLPTALTWPDRQVARSNLS